ncbi:matrixin family metalloprotease [Bdellovibrionota bacterium FG-1]
MHFRFNGIGGLVSLIVFLTFMGCDSPGAAPGALQSQIDTTAQSPTSPSSTATDPTLASTPPSTPISPSTQTQNPTPQPTPPVPVPTPSPTPSPSATSVVNAPVVGESCLSGDANKICLATHFVTYENSAGTAVASITQAGTIIHTMNTLWGKCDIGFQIMKYEAVDPTKYGLSYGAASQNELNQIRNTFSTAANELLAVTTGPWGTAVNAWTNMPGYGVYGAVMEASIVAYGGGIIYAHEFGHYLGLDHVSNSSNLMSPIIATTSTNLTAAQCQAAVNTVGSYWPAMVLK